MRIRLSIALLATPATLVAQTTKEEENKPIVVTARTLADTERALAECLARKCPPDEDSRATIAHAENQFVNGKMKDARGTLLKSIGRNGNQAKGFPTDVANLYRANARIAAHLGEREAFISSTSKTRDSLKSGLAADDWRVLASSIEIGDMRAQVGYPLEARQVYESVIKKAEEKGWKGMAQFAQLRVALLLISSTKAYDVAEGKKMLTAFTELSGDDARNLRIASRILLARKAKTAAESDALMKGVSAEYAQAGGAKFPQLLYSAPYGGERARDRGEGRTATNSMQTKSVNDNWADVGFWVTPEGKTSEIEIIRSSQKDTAWLKPVLSSIEGRIYSKTAAEPGAPGFFMVERYTLTAFFEQQLGTRIRQRSRDPHIERIDLTEIPVKDDKKGS